MRTTHRARTGGGHHTRKRCLGCGLATDDAPRAHACPRCGCDFDARPPRSYAEMEGLAPAPDAGSPDAALASARADAAATRWLLVLAGITGVAALVVVGTLVAAGG